MLMPLTSLSVCMLTLLCSTGGVRLTHTTLFLQKECCSFYVSSVVTMLPALASVRDLPSKQALNKPCA